MSNTINININDKNFPVKELITLIKKANIEPKQWFYSNGACGVELEYNQEYYYIDHVGVLSDDIWENHEVDESRLEAQNVFLTKEAAEKALEVEKTHNRILKRVMEINAENNWVADWSNRNQEKYYVFWSYYDNRMCYDYEKIFQTQGVIYMCKEAKDWLMSDEVSEEEFKAFCKIYN